MMNLGSYPKYPSRSSGRMQTDKMSLLLLANVTGRREMVWTSPSRSWSQRLIIRYSDPSTSPRRLSSLANLCSKQVASVPVSTNRTQCLPLTVAGRLLAPMRGTEGRVDRSGGLAKTGGGLRYIDNTRRGFYCCCFTRQDRCRTPRFVNFAIASNLYL